MENNQINSEKLAQITKIYQEAMDKFPENKLEEVTKLGSEVIKSVAKCQDLEKAVGKHSANIIESKHAANKSNERNV